MSHLSKVFNKVPLKVQKRSGFDLSHENLFTATVGTLIPASVEEVLPGDVVSVGSAMSVELPPLATNFKGRVDARLEAFFVPNRLLWAGWKDFICQDPNHAPNIPGYTVPGYVPQIALGASAVGPGTLSDYLGMRKPSTSGGLTNAEVNALPFLAYKKIWDDWYRDSNVQKPFFLDGVSQVASSSIIYACGMPYLRNTGVLASTTINIGTNSNKSVRGYNEDYLWNLNQRNFAKDYFTTMTAAPQSGSESSVEFTVTSTAGTTPGEYVGSGKFSIASLRAANSLQKWLEKNNIAGTRYYDQILAHYGVLPSDAVFQRAVLLGSSTVPVIVNSVNQNSQIGTNTQSKNPYANSTGAKFGSGAAFGKDRLINNFEVKEHGYVIILFSLVPHAYYSTGVRRYLSRYGSTSFAFPEFANIGDQEVLKQELCSDDILNAQKTTVGYNQRYSEYKYHDDEVHGLLADGENLESFVLQRGFGSSVTLGSDLLKIPTNFMDNVMVTTSGVSGFNAVVDVYFDAKYLRPLPEYCLPSLCDEYSEMKTVNVPKGGTRL